MKKIAYLLIALAVMPLLSSCLGDTTWKKYSDWREEQNEWLKTELTRTNEDGTPFYETLSANYDKNAIVYIHYYNDRNATKDNLVPLYTSTVDTKYHGSLYNGEPFDSSYTSTSPADSVSRFTVDGVVSGWSIALMNMHVGDSVRVLIPYNVGYGESSRSSIPPYSLMVFQLKLVNIAKYEVE